MGGWGLVGWGGGGEGAEGVFVLRWDPIAARVFPLVFNLP